MTHIQKQLIEIYEKEGFSEVKMFWQNNQNILKKLSPNEVSNLKNLMKRFCLIEKDDKTAEVISREDEQQNPQKELISEYLIKFGNFLYEGVAFEKNNEIAEQLYELAAEQGCIDVLYKVADMYKTGKNVQQNYEKAKKLFEKAAMKGSKLAQYRLGEMYMQGKGVEENVKEAIKWYRAANDSNDISTMKIPEGITCIEKFAFDGLENIRSVFIPKSVEKIEDFAFEGCKKLEDVIISNKDNICILDNAFADCENLSKASIKNILDSAFIFIAGNGKIKDFCISKAIKDNISWYDAIKFCNDLNMKQDLNPIYSNVNGFRLPTIQECKFAAKYLRTEDDIWCSDILKNDDLCATASEEGIFWHNPNRKFCLRVVRSSSN